MPWFDMRDHIVQRLRVGRVASTASGSDLASNVVPAVALTLRVWCEQAFKETFVAFISKKVHGEIVGRATECSTHRKGPPICVSISYEYPSSFIYKIKS